MSGGVPLVRNGYIAEASVVNSAEGEGDECSFSMDH